MWSGEGECFGNDQASDRVLERAETRLLGFDGVLQILWVYDPDECGGMEFSIASPSTGGDCVRHESGQSPLSSSSTNRFRGAIVAVQMDLSWLSGLTKPFTNLLNPVTERVGAWLGKRKPRLHVHFHPMQLVCSVGKEMQNDGSQIEVMHIHAMVDLTHDDDRQAIIIVNVYPEGTKNRIPSLSQFRIAPRKMLSHCQLLSLAVPVVGQKGKPWTGKLILVDQFERRYKTKDATYRWSGPVAPSSS